MLRDEETAASELGAPVPLQCRSKDLFVQCGPVSAFPHGRTPNSDEDLSAER